MREIKFRAWDKEDKAMLYGIEGCYDGVGSLGELPEDYFGAFIGAYTSCRSPHADRYEVMQFTGEIARDKKEVYEGDIIEYCHEDGGAYTKSVRGVVKYYLGRFECPYGIGEVVILKVISNIYENSELLK